MIYAGGQESQRGVAVLLDKETSKGIMKIIQHSDRLLLVKLKANPVDIVLLLVYMPTTAHKDEETDKLYDEIEMLLETEKGNDNIIIMGDWNAVVGESKDGNEVGSYGLGSRNDMGEAMVEFCKRRKLMITNTWFAQPRRRRYTWKKPGDTGRYQIDYILVRNRYRNGVKNCKTYPGADVNSYHNLLVMKCMFRLKRIQGKKRIKKWNLGKLEGIHFDNFQKEIEALMDGNKEKGGNDRWITLKDVSQNSAQTNIGYKKGRTPKKTWVTQEMLQKMNEKRRWE